MLEAIKKFVRGRGRELPRSRRHVVEEDDPAPAVGAETESRPLEVQFEEASTPPVVAAETEEQLTELQLEQAPDLPVRGKVKWFNPGKRYGFVELSDGSGDAFLHATVLQRIGVELLQPGETLEMRLTPGDRGPQVSEIVSVDRSTAAPPPVRRANFGSPYDRPAAEASVQETGTVKWYNTIKGFGFILRDRGGKDVFVHASALQRAGITNLNEGQRVIIGVVEGRKGPEATSIQLG
jgi:cold shock protein